MPEQFVMPPLGKSVILSFDANDTDFPIIGIYRKPTEGQGQTTPAIDAAHPEAAKYPNHKFVGSQIVKPDVLTVWMYRILPAPLLVGAQKNVPRRTPQKFITSETTAISKQDVTYGSPADTLSGEGSSSTVTPKDEAVSEKENRSLSLSTAGTTEFRKNGEDQIVTIASSTGSDGSAPAVSATTEIAEVNALGGGEFERVIGTTPEVFDQKSVTDADGIEFPNPGRYLAAPLLETTSTAQAATTAVPDALSVTGLGIISSEVSRTTEKKTRKTNRVLSGTNTTISGYEFDEATGLLLPISELPVVAGTSGVALQSDGTYAEIKPFNTAWSIKVSRKATALTNRTYHVSRHVSLPHVLTVFEPIVFDDAGGDIRYAGFQIVLKDFSGAYDITIYEEWKSTPHTITGITNFRPTGFHWITPYSSGSVPPCLHEGIEITGSTGTTDPVWGYLTWDYSFDATSPVEVTGLIVLVDEQQPYRGGWLRHKESITVS